MTPNEYVEFLSKQVNGTAMIADGQKVYDPRHEILFVDEMWSEETRPGEGTVIVVAFDLDLLTQDATPRTGKPFFAVVGRLGHGGGVVEFRYLACVKGRVLYESTRLHQASFEAHASRPLVSLSSVHHRSAPRRAS